MQNGARVVIRGWCLFAATLSAQQAELGPAPEPPRDAPPAASGSLTVNRLVTGNWFDTSNRAAVVDAFNNTYLPTQDVPMGWTGNLTGCSAGDVSQTWKDAVLRRINWFRGMAGVPMSVTLNSALSSKNQEAALMMSANRALSHSPPTNWACYSANGAEAAGKSNICYLSGYRNQDPGCVAIYVADTGSNNQAVGHRRWLFYPQTTQMGTGDVSESTGGFPRTNAIWVIDSATFNNARPTTREEFVAWPPQGYVPYQVVPARWSFSYKGADFSSATVDVSRPGINITATILPISNGAGEPTIVWEPATTFPKPSADTPYTVTLNNVRIGGTPRSFTYTVIVMDPVSTAPQTVSISLQTKPASLQVSGDGAQSTAPATFIWTAGSQHTIAVASPQTSGSTRMLWASWNHGGGQSQSITVPTSATTYIANFTRQHRLATGASPSNGGSAAASPASGDAFYNEGATVQVTASPASGFRFTGWSGDLAGATNPASILVSAPKSVTANFAQNCSYALSGGASDFASGGGSAALTVTTAAGCNWSAASGAGWITLTATTSGVGTGVINYSVQSNSSSAARTGGITVSGTVFSISQQAAAPVVIPGPSALRFIAVTPCRLVDTRSSGGKSGAFGPPSFDAGSARDIPIPQSGCGIPSTALAYSLNVTAAPPAPLSYVTIWPSGQPQPLVSTLNSWDGRVVANAAIVPAGTGGAIRLFASNATDLILDINGYFVPSSTANALAFYPVTPCRAADTRTGGGKSGEYGPPSLDAAGTRSLSIPNSGCGIPSSAQAFSLNVTVAPKGPLAFLTAWPGGQPMPVASTLNSFDGVVAANAAIVPAGANGNVSFFASNATDVIVDVNGYFAAPSAAGLNFYALTPCRAADTRTGQGKSGAFGPPTMAAQATRTFELPAAGCGIPSTARAHSLNVTVAPPAPLAFLTLWPSGSGMPVASTLNSFNAQAMANAALVPGGPTGAINIFVSNATEVILDVNGYFGQ